MAEPARSAIAKAAHRLLPFLILCYAVNFLDRVNVGFAALAMNEDLGFTPDAFRYGSGADTVPLVELARFEVMNGHAPTTSR